MATAIIERRELHTISLLPPLFAEAAGLTYWAPPQPYAAGGWAWLEADLDHQARPKLLLRCPLPAGLALPTGKDHGEVFEHGPWGNYLPLPTALPDSAWTTCPLCQGTGRWRYTGSRRVADCDCDRGIIPDPIPIDVGGWQLFYAAHLVLLARAGVTELLAGRQRSPRARFRAGEMDGLLWPYA